MDLWLLPKDYTTVIIGENSEAGRRMRREEEKIPQPMELYHEN